jgi:hypothetical protein
MEFGVTEVYSLQTTSEKELSDGRRASRHLVGNSLFGRDITFSTLSSLLAKGWEIRTTGVTETFTYNSYKEKYKGKLIPLFAISPKGKLEIFTVEKKVDPLPGWTVISLLSENERQPSPDDGDEVLPA